MPKGMGYGGRSEHYKGSKIRTPFKDVMSKTAGKGTSKPSKPAYAGKGGGKK